ncbi:MAG TPA: hypothetical protein VLA68_02715 [Nitrososphaera sp.]|nr:hypothetical protein [Nitrososphaera sp.]
MTPANICDIMVKAMRIYPSIQLSDLPRMADFAVWGEAIARAMGYKEIEFLQAYYDNIGKQNIEAIENHPLGLAIAKWVASWGNDETGQEKKSWQGSPQELLEQLAIIAEAFKMDTTHRHWPKAPNSLSRRLNLIKSNLLDGLGIKVDIGRLTTGEKVGTAYIMVRKIPPVSPIPPVDAQTTLDSAGDGGHTEDTFGTKGEQREPK